MIGRRSTARPDPPEDPNLHAATGVAIDAGAGRRNSPHPNFFIVGAVKGGTTSLYHYLASHPQVYMSPIKEPCYFATDHDPAEFAARNRSKTLMHPEKFIWGEMKGTLHQAYVRNFDDYLGLFRRVRHEKAVGEASVAYLFSRRAAHEIKARIPDAKIVMILRDPAERAFSHYMMQLQLGVVARSFAEELQADLQDPHKGWNRAGMYIEPGLYFEQVKRYLDVFDRARVKIYLSEDLRDRRNELLRDLYGFLGVDTQFIPDDERFNVTIAPRFPRFNLWASKMGLKRPGSSSAVQRLRDSMRPVLFTRSPKLSKKDRAMLLNYFVEDIGKLQNLLGRDLSHWMR